MIGTREMFSIRASTSYHVEFMARRAKQDHYQTTYQGEFLHNIRLGLPLRDYDKRQFGHGRFVLGVSVTVTKLGVFTFDESLAGQRHTMCGRPGGPALSHFDNPPSQRRPSKQ